MNCEGIADNSLLMEDSFSGKGSKQDERTTNTLEEECPGDVPESVLDKENENCVSMDTDDSTCNKCDYVGKDTGSLKNHIELSHESRISDEDVEKLGGKILTEFFCTLCVFVTDNNDDLNNHSQLKHGSNNTETATVDLTNSFSLLDDDLLFSNETKAQSPRYNCGKCEFSNEDKEELNSHIDEHHNTHITHHLRVKVLRRIPTLRWISLHAKNAIYKWIAKRY
jgi:hypothetical protein